VTAPANTVSRDRGCKNIMNRSGCRLKPIAPRPAADSYAPSSAVSAVSLDPKDYVYPHADYVWGVPQQMHPGVLQQSPGYINPYMAANTGMYGAYGLMMTSQWGQQAALPQFQPQLTPTPSGASRNRDNPVYNFSSENGAVLPTLRAGTALQNMRCTLGGVKGALSPA
jgi:hypothetical protein